MSTVVEGSVADAPFKTFKQAATKAPTAIAKGWKDWTDGNVCNAPAVSGQSTVVVPSANVCRTIVDSNSACMWLTLVSPQS